MPTLKEIVAQVGGEEAAAKMIQAQLKALEGRKRYTNKLAADLKEFRRQRAAERAKKGQA